MDDAARRLRDDAREARAHDEHEQHAEPADRAAADRLEQDVGPARQEEGREEVPVEPALIRQEGDADERAADERDRNLGSPARGRVLGGTVVMREGHRRSGAEQDMLVSPPSRVVVMSSPARVAPLDRLLRPVHRWVWSDFDRRVRKLLAFAEVESDGGRDILRAAEVTPDPLLRRLYLEHAIDELHHGDLFRQRGAALLRTRSDAPKTLFNGTPLPGGHGLDDLSVEDEPDHRLLAFLHVAEKAAAGRFTIYRELVDDDPRRARSSRRSCATKSST